MPQAWFESIAVVQRRAQRTLPRSVYRAVLAGADRGLTLDDNTAAFSEIGLLPVTAGQSPSREMATTVMGETASMPVVIAPTGVQAVHPDGELAIAGASASRGVPMGLSSFASQPIEAVAAANRSTFMQLYWSGARSSIAERVERARSAGVKGLILTLDWSFVHSRDWGSPAIPQKLGFREMARHTPEVIARPRWLARWLRAGRLPTLGVPNMGKPGEDEPLFWDAYGEWMSTPPATWDDVAWLRQQWDGPLMVKGVMRVDEAQRAVAAGATAISVSNHGGNNLDGTPAPLRVIGEIAHAVGDHVEVLMDGGVRRGSDVVKALALGARAVMLGRAVLWGLAANGQRGVENVLDVIRAGIDSTLFGLGCSSIHDVSPDHLLVPGDFAPLDARRHAPFRTTERDAATAKTLRHDPAPAY